MSTPNITAFIDKIQADASLREQVSAIFADADQAIAEVFARLSAETGTPFSAEEFLSEGDTSLSEAELAGVVGGAAGIEAPPSPGHPARFGPILRKWMSFH